MYYRKLGNTGLEVSELSFGTIPILQGNIPVLPAYFNLDESEALAVMAHAFQMGCNLFDTAIVPEYGDAEIKLGQFAACVGRDRIILSDKARFFGGGEMYRAVETSCENLGTVPDLYFVHQVDASHEEEVFARGGALDALAELKAEGKIRFAGVATHYYDILLRGAQDERVDVLQGSGNLSGQQSVRGRTSPGAFSSADIDWLRAGVSCVECSGRTGNQGAGGGCDGMGYQKSQKGSSLV